MIGFQSGYFLPDELLIYSRFLGCMDAWAAAGLLIWWASAIPGVHGCMTKIDSYKLLLFVS